MIHSLTQIIHNQKKFKDNIIQYYLNDYRVAKNELKEIKSEDPFIKKEKIKLQKKFKKIKAKYEIEKLFFTHAKRNKKYYAWWDIISEKALILTYEKK